MHMYVSQSACMHACMHTHIHIHVPSLTYPSNSSLDERTLCVVATSSQRASLERCSASITANDTCVICLW